jgi:lipid-binding SYLF domain-containing protein
MNSKEAVRLVVALLVVVMFIGLASCATAPLSKSDKEQQQDSVRDMAKTTLSQFYTKYPAARDAVAKSSGYSVFSDFGFKVWTLGGARGKGVAVNNATKQDIFMEMLEFQPGMGLGASKFRVVFLFDTPEAFNNFVNSGWEVGVNLMAEAKTKTEGGALAGAVTPAKGVKMYQLDEEGLIVGVSLTAAKYYKDKNLN